MTENMRSTTLPDVADELDDEPYNPATGHPEPRVTEFHDDADGSVPRVLAQDSLDDEAYNPATGHIETPTTRAVEDPS
jgi:hypothetical protein